jgi:hypothetical protein
MKKLSKETLAGRDEIAARLRSRFSDLEAAIEGFNTIMAGEWSVVEAAIEAYNTKLDDEWGNGLGPMIEDYNSAVADATEWKQETAQAIQEYMDERSEKWQESEAAGRYTAWRDEFDSEVAACDLERPDDLSIEEPGEMAMDLEDEAELLEQLPEELES